VESSHKGALVSKVVFYFGILLVTISIQFISISSAAATAAEQKQFFAQDMQYDIAIRVHKLATSRLHSVSKALSHVSAYHQGTEDTDNQDQVFSIHLHPLAINH
jgi:hypothetical protein